MDADGRRVTIRDVAARAGVSIGTVSRVLTGQAAVSDALKANVLKAVEELGYHPNSMARSLRNRTTGYIGFLVPNLMNPIYAAYVSAAERQARESGYNLVVGTTGDDSFRERGMLQFLKGGRVDGAALFIGEDSQPDLASTMRNLGLPAVVIERTAPGTLDSILVDHRTATRNAVAYLLALGHRRIGLLTAAPRARPTTERIAGFQEAFAAAGRPWTDAFVSTECMGDAMSLAVASELVRRRDRPTAIMVIASGLAGVLRALMAAEIRIPEDMSVMCLGETELCTLVRPAITTVLWDHAGIGRDAVQLLVNRLNAPAGGVQGRHIVVPSELVLRASCGPPPAGD